MIGIGHTQENGGCIASAPDKLAWPKDFASLDKLSRGRCLRLFVSPLVFRRLVEVMPHPLKAANKSLIQECTPMPAKQKILLVEDHEDTSDLMVLILSQLDYDVATAASISGALGLADSTLTSANISVNGTIQQQFFSIRQWRFNTIKMRR